MSTGLSKRTLSILAASFFVLFVTLAVIYIQERSSNPTHALERFSYVNPTRNLIDQKHFFSTINPLRVDIRETS